MIPRVALIAKSGHTTRHVFAAIPVTSMGDLVADDPPRMRPDGGNGLAMSGDR